MHAPPHMHAHSIFSVFPGHGELAHPLEHSQIDEKASQYDSNIHLQPSRGLGKLLMSTTCDKYI